MSVTRQPVTLSWRAEKVLDLLRIAACTGARCPTNSHIVQHCGGSLPVTDSVASLARKGQFRVEVYAKNWRVVIFPDGKRTAPSPYRDDLTPWRVIDSDGTRNYGLPGPPRVRFNIA